MQANCSSIGLYVHIPFCKKKCRYCDFYSEQYSESIADDFIESLVVEWGLVKEKYCLENVPIATLYFGGGTPSILSFAQWEKIITQFVQKLPRSIGYEWSIECNPDSFSEETARLWLDSGVTRLSFGVQSMHDKELTLLGRSHNRRRAFDSLNHALVGRFASIGADLMYGIPGQTLASLEASLEGVLSCEPIKHLSAYELTIAGDTPFGRHRRLLRLPEEEVVAAITDCIKQKTADKGFDQYEVSNYAQKGHRCRHNEAYWNHKPYIGLGPGAHSYLPPRRFSNIKNVQAYITRMKNRLLPTDFKEIIDTQTLSREMIFLGLRTDKGINESHYRTMTGLTFASSQRLPLLQQFISRGMMEYCAPYWKLTDRGLAFADAVARDVL